MIVACFVWLLFFTDFESPRENIEYLKFTNGSVINVCTALSEIISSYPCQSSLFPVFGAMRRKTNDEYIKSQVMSLISSTVIYLIIGTLGVLLFGSDTRGDVLENINQIYREDDSTSLYAPCYLI